MTSTSNTYFIITRKPDSLLFHVGQICYARYRRTPGNPRKLQVSSLGSRSTLSSEVDLSVLEELTGQEAGLLLAVPDDADRLKLFTDKHALETALGLSLGSEVTVDEDGKKLRGIIRYVGPMTETDVFQPVAGTFFGIELQKLDKGKGNTDGTYRVRQLFSCEEKCDVFAPFSRISPVVSGSLPASVSEVPPQLETEGLNPGDRVTYFVDNTCRYGMVVDVLPDYGKYLVRISVDTDETGKRGGELLVPLDMVAKGEVPAGPEDMDVGTTPEEAHPGLSMGLNSRVEVTLAEGNSYGIIRWLGSLPARTDVMVGLELEEDRGVSDGTFKDQRLFTCPLKRALFVKLSSCRPDSRFHSASANRSQEMLRLDNADAERCTKMPADIWDMRTVPPISTEQINQLLIGRMKGIQGHCNSCYMDATLFSGHMRYYMLFPHSMEEQSRLCTKTDTNTWPNCSLFSCSSVLDSMLFKSTTPQDAPIQTTLLCDIVGPLRSKGFVESRYIMKLRQQLQKLGYSRSFTTDEKDPEEFLIVIMHHILALDPLLKLSAAGKVQESYCYQIFLDQNHSLVLPTVQQLLEHSFHSSGLKLAEVPSCLILQMPRFGKKFKMFDKIIPSLQVDITDLLSEGPQQCMLCGNLALEECTDCFKDPIFSSTGFKIFCQTCLAQVHSHPQRRSHQPTLLNIPKGYVGHGVPHTLTRDKLELFAVLCIETSHYVSFVKHGPSSRDWIFFDSMADRQGESEGFNIPKVQACPEVGEYLEMSAAELANQVPRDMKGVAKRLFCDAYMYLYQSTSMCLYR